MADTNVLFSALLFPESRPAKALFSIIEQHNLILCDYIISELKKKTRRCLRHNILAIYHAEAQRTQRAQRKEGRWEQVTSSKGVEGCLRFLVVLFPILHQTGKIKNY
jgi:predicted nucleic acid-binding protein